MRNIGIGHITLFLACIAIIFLAVLFFQNQQELRELHLLVKNKENSKETPVIPVIQEPHPHRDHIDRLEKLAGTPLERVANIIIAHEGVREKPYLDTSGKVTIGIGRSLTTNGISTEELHAIVSEIDYKHILSNTTVQRGRILINSLEDANRIFKEPLTKEDIQLLLADDLKVVTAEAKSVFGEMWASIDTPRQEVIIDVLYNLGLPHFKEFKHFIESVKTKNWQKAASDLLMSEAARQNVNRYIHNAAVLQSGDEKDFSQ